MYDKLELGLTKRMEHTVHVHKYSHIITIVTLNA